MCLLGTLDPEKHIFNTPSLSLCGPKFPSKVVFGACCFKNNIQKKERERPQRRDRVVKGITALKITPTLNTHALERERERERERELLLFSSVVVFILWTTTAFGISQSAKRGTCAASHLNSFWIENLI